MKKAILMVAAIATATLASAQITLEHSYTGKNMSLQVVTIEGEGNKYMALDTLTQNVQLYNADHTLWKTIATAPSAGYSLVNWSYPSKYLFNSDGNVEILVSYYSTSPLNYHTKIISETGAVVQDFSNHYYGFVKNVNGAWKLLLYNTGAGAFGSRTYSDVYSLPGVYTGMKNINGETSGTVSPNPASSSFTLAYRLPSDTHVAELNVYDVSGQLVKSMTITDLFNDVVINSEDLAPGMYIYNISGGGKLLLSDKVEIK